MTSKVEKALKIIKFLEEKENDKAMSSYYDNLIWNDDDPERQRNYDYD
jgi:hypothetical protein